MPSITLTKGFTAIVDLEDYGMLARHHWQVGNHHGSFSYAIATVYHPTKKTLRMHRLVLAAKLGRDLLPHEQVDHINKDALDNRRENLRLATLAQNCCNRGKRSDNTAPYKGIVKRSKWANAKWAVRIQIDGKQVKLGHYSTPEEAARAYDARAKEIHGEFACLNFPAR